MIRVATAEGHDAAFLTRVHDLAWRNLKWLLLDDPAAIELLDHAIDRSKPRKVGRSGLGATVTVKRHDSCVQALDPKAVKTVLECWFAASMLSIWPEITAAADATGVTLGPPSSDRLAAARKSGCLLPSTETLQSALAGTSPRTPLRFARDENGAPTALPLVACRYRVDDWPNTRHKRAILAVPPEEAERFCWLAFHGADAGVADIESAHETSPEFIALHRSLWSPILLRPLDFLTIGGASLGYHSRGATEAEAIEARWTEAGVAVWTAQEVVQLYQTLARVDAIRKNRKEPISPSRLPASCWSDGFPEQLGLSTEAVVAAFRADLEAGERWWATRSAYEPLDASTPFFAHLDPESTDTARILKHLLLSNADLKRLGTWRWSVLAELSDASLRAELAALGFTKSELEVVRTQLRADAAGPEIPQIDALTLDAPALELPDGVPPSLAGPLGRFPVHLADGRSFVALQGIEAVPEGLQLTLSLREIAEDGTQQSSTLLPSIALTARESTRSDAATCLGERIDRLATLPAALLQTATLTTRDPLRVLGNRPEVPPRLRAAVDRIFPIHGSALRLEARHLVTGEDAAVLIVAVGPANVKWNNWAKPPLLRLQDYDDDDAITRAIARLERAPDLAEHSLGTDGVRDALCLSTHRVLPGRQTDLVTWLLAIRRLEEGSASRRDESREWNHNFEDVGSQSGFTESDVVAALRARGLKEAVARGLVDSVRRIGT